MQFKFKYGDSAAKDEKKEQGEGGTKQNKNLVVIIKKFRLNF